MLVLVKTKDGVEKAINITNAEFEATRNTQDASLFDLKIFKENGEIIETTITEESYTSLIEALQRESKMISLTQ